jgi:hypothetical protein
MKIAVNFEIDGVEDYFVIEGETLLDIRKDIKYEIEKRGLNREKNNLWSEKFYEF